MAENESMEGKNLATEEKKKMRFEEIILYVIEKMEKEKINVKNVNTSKEGISINIKKIDRNEYELVLLGKKIGSVAKNKEVSYNIEGLKRVREKLEKTDRPVALYDDLGLPDIEYLEYLEKDKTEEKEEQKDEQDLSKDMEEKEDEELKEEKQEGEDEEEITLDDIAEQEGLDELQKNEIIELRTNRKVTDKHKLPGLIPELEKYEKVFLIPNKNDEQYSYKIKGVTHNKKVEEIDSLKQTEGSNPTQSIVTINSKNSNKMKEETAIAMYKKDEKEGIAIKRGQYNEKEVTYYRRMEVRMPEGGSKEVYLTIPLPQQNTRNTDPYTPEEAKELADKQKTSEDELEETMEKYFILVELSKKDLPEKADPTKNGIQVEEITPKEFEKLREGMVQAITEELNDENEGYPANRRNIAAKITQFVLDEGMDYSDAKNKALGKNKNQEESNEKTPYDRDHKRRH